MKKKFLVALAAVAVVAIGSAAAALVTLTLDRDVQAGVVTSDFGNAPIVFAAVAGNQDAVLEDGDGEFSVDLTKAVSGADFDGFNPDALYVIGTGGLFTITNNSDDTVNVSLNGTAGLVLEGSATIAPGATQTYYFTLDTNDMTAGNEINGVLRVQSENY